MRSLSCTCEASGADGYGRSMLLDDSSQHLIAFNASGTTFTVSNTTAFAKEVLPKHFKHRCVGSRFLLDQKG